MSLSREPQGLAGRADIEHDRILEPTDTHPGLSILRDAQIRARHVPAGEFRQPGPRDAKRYCVSCTADLANGLNHGLGGALPTAPTPDRAPTQLHFDTNGDDLFSPLDVLSGVNFINAQSSAGGEGEAPDAALAAGAARDRIWAEWHAASIERNGGGDLSEGTAPVFEAARSGIRQNSGGSDRYFAALADGDAERGEEHAASCRVFGLAQLPDERLDATLDELVNPWPRLAPGTSVPDPVRLSRSQP
jgi:hypothetical protein